MSLTRQVLGLLRAATEPQSTSQLREQLDAMHVANAGDVNKRVYWLVGKGVVESIGKGRDSRYRIIPGRKLEEMEARQDVRAKAVCTIGRRKNGKDGAPTFRDQLLDVLREHPGALTVQIKKALTDAGIPLAKNEPSAALHVLQRQGRVRAEGNPPTRIYFLVDATATGERLEAPAKPAKVKGAKAQADAQDGGLVAVVKHHGATSDLSGPTRRLRKSEISTDRSTPCGPSQAATEAPSLASIPRTEGSAVTAGKDRHISDDPIDRLADVIQQHLELAAPWITSTLIAEDLDEEPLDVARALRRLVDAKRANVRTIAGVREYAVGVDWQPEAPPITLSSVLQAHNVSEGAHAQTGQLEDIYGPISSEPEPASPFEFSRELPPVPEADKAAHRQAIDAAREALRDRYNDATAHQPSPHCMCVDCCKAFEPTPSAAPVPPPAYNPDQVSFRNTQIANLVAAIGSNPNTVAGLSRCIALDIEDAIGRACDQRMPHHAIKALATAAACMRRAIDTFTTGAPAPLTATDGVLQS